MHPALEGHALSQREIGCAAVPPCTVGVVAVEDVAPMESWKLFSLQDRLQRAHIRRIGVVAGPCPPPLAGACPPPLAGACLRRHWPARNLGKKTSRAGGRESVPVGGRETAGGAGELRDLERPQPATTLMLPMARTLMMKTMRPDESVTTDLPPITYYSLLPRLPTTTYLLRLA